MRHLLSQFELARCLSAIEAVDRLGKPAAEIGSKRLAPDALPAFMAELHRLADESAGIRWYAYDDGNGRFTFGCYRFEWVERALDFVEKMGGSLDEHTRAWVQGLIFGYRPEAIENYIRASSESGGSESMLRRLCSDGMAGRARSSTERSARYSTAKNRSRIADISGL